MRVLGANGETAEVQPPKQLAHAAFVQVTHRPRCGHANRHGGTAQRRRGQRSAPCSTQDADFSLLDPAQARRPAGSEPAPQPIQTCLVVAVNPVAQRLTVHPAKPRRILAAETMSTIAMARMRDACLASADRLAAARKSTALISIRVIATPAISRPRESMQTTSIHITGPKGIPLGESRGVLPSAPRPLVPFLSPPR